jgi:hypothetical protein
MKIMSRSVMQREATRAWNCSGHGNISPKSETPRMFSGTQKELFPPAVFHLQLSRARPNATYICSPSGCARSAACALCLYFSAAPLPSCPNFLATDSTCTMDTSSIPFMSKRTWYDQKNRVGKGGNENRPIVACISAANAATSRCIFLFRPIPLSFAHSCLCRIAVSSALALCCLVPCADWQEVWRICPHPHVSKASGEGGVGHGAAQEVNLLRSGNGGIGEGFL